MGLILLILNQISICTRKCKMIHSGYHKIIYWNSLPHCSYDWQGCTGNYKMTKLGLFQKNLQFCVRSPSVLEYGSKSMQSKHSQVSNFINLLTLIVRLSEIGWLTKTSFSSNLLCCKFLFFGNKFESLINPHFTSHSWHSHQR